MALDNLQRVTETLKNLIVNCFSVSTAWPLTGQTLEVSALPPDKLKGDNTIGIYLYHIVENSFHKNIPSPGIEIPPVRYTPMALDLYYLLTAHSDLQIDVPKDDISSLREQQMMSIAMKAFHDYPIINNTTKINNKIIFTSDLIDSNNLLRIELLPVTQTEAVSYWTAGSSPLRLAAYYRVSVVFLEPEESKSRAGRVLSYGNYIFVGAGPRIDGCSNTLSFNLPGKTVSNQVELRPAQVPFGELVTFSGSGFVGDKVDLLLKNAGWGSPIAVDPSSWGLTFSEIGASIKIYDTITDEDGNTFTILPGIYSACIQVTKQITLSDGTSREIKHISNECPFAIVPKLNISNNDRIANPDEIIDIDGYLFSYKVLVNPLPVPTYKELITIQVYVGNFKYQQDTGPGTFSVESENKIKIHLAKDLVKGDYPLRIFANGVESPPNWITIP
jgi:hypothetical protein